jgi:hypothetical protein
MSHRPAILSQSPSISHHHPITVTGVHHKSDHRNHPGAHRLVEEVHLDIVILLAKPRIQGSSGSIQFDVSLSVYCGGIGEFVLDSVQDPPRRPPHQDQGNITHL